MSFSLKKAHERNATIKELSTTVQNESSLSLPILMVLDNKASSLKEKKKDNEYSENEHNSTLSSFLHSKDSIDSKSEYELQNIHASIKQKMREKILLGDITPSDIILFSMWDFDFTTKYSYIQQVQNVILSNEDKFFFLAKLNALLNLTKKDDEKRELNYIIGSLIFHGFGSLNYSFDSDATTTRHNVQTALPYLFSSWKLGKKEVARQIADGFYEIGDEKNVYLWKLRDNVSAVELNKSASILSTYDIEQIKKVASDKSILSIK